MGMTEDLITLKDDMTAFIAGTGLKRFQGYVSDDVQSVMWDAEGNPERVAKKSGAVLA